MDTFHSISSTLQFVSICSTAWNCGVILPIHSHLLLIVRWKGCLLCVQCRFTAFLHHPQIPYYSFMLPCLLFLWCSSCSPLCRWRNRPSESLSFSQMEVNDVLIWFLLLPSNWLIRKRFGSGDLFGRWTWGHDLGRVKSQLDVSMIFTFPESELHCALQEAFRILYQAPWGWAEG